MQDSEFLSQRWIQTHHLEKKLKPLPQSLSEAYKSWHQLINNPCLYIHDTKDSSRKRLFNPQKLVSAYRLLSVHYEQTRAALQHASTRDARRACLHFYKQTSHLDSLPSDGLIPKSHQSMIIWSRNHFIKITRLIIQKMRLNHEIVHFAKTQMISAELLQKRSLWFYLNDEYQLRRMALQERKQKTKRFLVLERQKTTACLDRYQNHKAMKPRLNTESRLAFEALHYQKQFHQESAFITKLKANCLSPAFRLQVMSHEQMLNFGRQAISTLEILSLYQTRLQTLINTSKTRPSSSMLAALNDLKQKTSHSLVKANFILEAMYLRLAICHQQSLEQSDPISWIHQQLARYKVPIHPSTRLLDHPIQRRVESLAWIKELYDFIVYFPFKDEKTLALQAKTLICPIFYHLPHLKKYHAQNHTEQKLLFCPQFWQQTLHLKLQISKNTLNSSLNIVSELNRLTVQAKAHYSNAYFWQKYLGNTQDIFHEVIQTLETIHENYQERYYSEEVHQKRKKTLKFCHEIHAAMTPQDDGQAALELLAPWLYSQAATLPCHQPLITVDSSDLSHCLASILMIQDQEAEHLLAGDQAQFLLAITKHQLWAKLIQREWPPYEETFEASLLHNELIFTLTRLLNPWSPCTAMPDMNTSQKNAMIKIIKRHCMPLLFAMQHPIMQQKRTIQQKIMALEDLCGQTINTLAIQPPSKAGTTPFALYDDMFELESIITQNQEWIIFHVSQWISGDSCAYKKLNSCEALLLDLLQRTTWTSPNIECKQDFIMDASHSLETSPLRDKQPGNTEQMYAKLRCDMDAQSFWHALWVHHQLTQLWLKFSAGPCNEKTIALAHHKTKVIMHSLQNLPNKKLLAEMQDFLPKLMHDINKHSLFTSSQAAPTRTKPMHPAEP